MDPITMGATMQGGQQAMGGLSDVVNLGLQIWAMKKQEKATATKNDVEGSQYNQEYADKRSDVKYGQDRNKQADALNAAAVKKQDSNDYFSNIMTSFNSLPAQKRNDLATLWQSKTGRVA